MWCTAVPGRSAPRGSGARPVTDGCGGVTADTCHVSALGQSERTVRCRPSVTRGCRPSVTRGRPRADAGARRRPTRIPPVSRPVTFVRDLSQAPDASNRLTFTVTPDGAYGFFKSPPRHHEDLQYVPIVIHQRRNKMEQIIHHQTLYLSISEVTFKLDKQNNVLKNQQYAWCYFVWY